MELRKDYVLDRYVIVAENRSKRPHFKPILKDNQGNYKINNPFAPGNEEQTPPELGRISYPDGRWKIRWIGNKYPALLPEGQKEIKTDNEFFTFSNAYGYHELIIETDKNDQLWDLSKEELVEIFNVYKERINYLKNQDGIKYVNLIKNQGDLAGASLVHSHAQVFANNIVPTEVKMKIEGTKKFDSCPYCKIIDIEKNSDRKCFENEEFVAFTPYASRFNYELLVLPKKHIKTLDECDMNQLTDIMKKVFDKLKEINCDYNFYIHYSPDDEDLHFQICICPRIAKFGGFEFGSGIVINTVSPESAAKFYRGENEDS